MRTFIIVCIFQLHLCSVFAQKQGQALVDSLLLQLPAAASDTNKVHLLGKLSLALYSIEPDKGLEYGRQGLALAESLRFDAGRAMLSNSIAANHYMKSEYAEALGYFETAVGIYKALDDKNGLSGALGNMAIIFQNQSNYPKSLEYHFMALKMNEESGMELKIASNLQNIGIVYYETGDYDRALDYYNKSLVIFERVGNRNGMAGNYTNIGNIYSVKKNYDLAVEYNLKALRIYESTHDYARIASCLGNAGNAYFEQGNILAAIDFNFRALKINRQIGSKNGEAINLGNIGSLYYSLAQGTTDDRMMPDSLKDRKQMLVKGMEYILATIAISEEIGDLDQAQKNYKALAEAQQYDGNYRDALKNFRSSIALRDSIFSEENKSRIQNLETSREEDIREKEKEIQRLQLQKARNERWYFLMGLLLLGMLLLVVLNRFRVKKKSSERLEKAYNDLKSTQQQLIQQEKLASLGALTAGIAHEIKNPLNFVNNFSDLSYEQIDELLATDDKEEKDEIAVIIKQNLGKISQHGKRADSIVQSMLQHARHGDPESESTDINKLCNEIADLAFHGMKANVPGFNVEIKKIFAPEIPSVKAIAQDISRVLVNLLNNAFYAVNERNSHARSKGMADTYKPLVIISTALQDKNITISIRDNGHGIPEKIRQQIFEPFFTTKPAGQGTGLGLSICYDIIKAHGGDLKVESRENDFTEFTIMLPV